ncbi:MAG: DUF2961 domain-containing protein, partial [Acidobacteriaceae bacterium]
MLSRSALRFFLASFSVFFLCSAALAQKALRNDDVSVDGFYQFTQTATGNGISDTATKSLGGAASFRHSFHPLLGFEAAYDYTRFTESYTGQAFGYQHNGAPYVVDPERIGGRYCLYRWHTEGPIAFEKSIRVTIEHGHANHRSDNFYSTAY